VFIFAVRSRTRKIIVSDALSARVTVRAEGFAKKAFANGNFSRVEIRKDFDDMHNAQTLSHTKMIHD
jgi:hypothetical protein